MKPIKAMFDLRLKGTTATLVSRVVDDATRELLREAVCIPVVCLEEMVGW